MKYYPINRKIQVITSDYGPRWRNGKKEYHNGIDLRTYNRISNLFNWITAPEDMILKEIDCDRWGDYAKFKPLESHSWCDLLIFYHVSFTKLIKSLDIGTAIEQGESLGKSQIKGLNTSHHLHFACKFNNIYFDPKVYFKNRYIECRKK